MSKNTVLIIEDDTTLLRGLKDNFQSKAYRVLTAGDGETGLAAALNDGPDLILLDIMLPKVNGYEICRSVREHGLDTPIIMLTAKGQTDDIIRGLNLGADDYVTKPFSIRELMARANAFLRRRKGVYRDSYRFGDCELDLGSHRFLRNGKEVALTPKEFRLLEYFVGRTGRALTRDDILLSVWGDTVLVTARSVDRCVRTLRSKIEPDPSQPTFIRTIPDIGYRFEIPEGPLTSAEPPHTPPDPTALRPDGGRLLRPGDSLGSYRIRALLSDRGKAETYQAHDARRGRDVVIQVLPAEVAGDGAVVSRIERQTKAVAALSHPNIAPITGIASDATRVYAVADLLQGESLAECLARGPLECGRALEIAAAAAEGLAAAHGKGITHCGIRPGTLFLTTSGDTKILDFGLARHLYPALIEAADTPDTMLCEKIAYFSPEQVNGQAVVAQSDLFSLGVVLHAMLTGRSPFAGSTRDATVTAILTEDPPPPKGPGETIPPDVDRIIRHCLEKDPSRRFQSARDLSFALSAPRDG